MIFDRSSHNRQLSKEYNNLSRARAVLAGLDESGRSSHPSMFDEDVISFAHGEGVRRPHPRVVGAGVRALIDTEQSSLENYLFLQRLKRLDEAISERFRRIGVPRSLASNVIIDSGTTKLFVAFMQQFTRPGDVFLTAPGFYHPLAEWCASWGVRLACVPTKQENSYKLRSEDVAAWWGRHVGNGGSTPPVGLFLFNPTMIGAVYNLEELEQLAEIVIKYDLVVLEDAIFAETEFDNNRPSYRIAAVDGMADRVFTVSGGSKTHGLANIRIAWGCGPNNLIERLEAFVTSTSATIPHLAKLMAVAALEAPESYLARHRLECRNRAQQITALVKRINAEVRIRFNLPTDWDAIKIECQPMAGHSILLSFKALYGFLTPAGYSIEDSIDLTRFFLQTSKVAFSPGLSIGWDGCELRCNYACVGTQFTFPASKRAEARTVAAEVSEYYSSNISFGIDLSALIQADSGTTDVQDVHDEHGFSAGRSVIEEAFLERVGPAIHQLIELNSGAIIGDAYDVA